MKMKRIVTLFVKILAGLMALLVILYVLRFERVLLKPLMTGVNIPAQYGQIIVVFGGGMRKDTSVRIGFSTKERLDQAIALYRKKARPVLVSDGSLYRKSPAIPLITDYLLSQGVDRERIIIDGDSQTTADNVRKTKEIVGGLGLTEVIICTSPYHQKRSQVLLRNNGTLNFLIARSTQSEVFEAKSLGQRLRNLNLILHEYVALFFMSLHDLFR